MSSGTVSTSRKLRRRSSAGEHTNKRLIDESKDTGGRDKDPSQPMVRPSSINMRGEPPADLSLGRVGSSSSSLRRSNAGPPLDPPTGGRSEVSLRRNISAESLDRHVDKASQSLVRRKMSDSLRNSNLVMPFDYQKDDSPRIIHQKIGSSVRMSTSMSPVDQQLGTGSQSLEMMPFDVPINEFPGIMRQKRVSSVRLSLTSNSIERHFGRAVEGFGRRTQSGFVIPVNLPVEESKGEGLQKIAEDVREQGQPDKASSLCDGIQTQPVKVEMVMESPGPSAVIPTKTAMRYGSTVLVVDDSVINLKMMSRLAAKRCDKVIEAKDGVEAVAAVRASMKSGVPVDLVLMDFQMPNMDGPTAASVMRKMGYTGPIIGVTGNVMTADKEFFISKGANKVLFKPVDANQVDFAVRALQLTGKLPQATTT